MNLGQFVETVNKLDGQSASDLGQVLALTLDGQCLNSLLGGIRFGLRGRAERNPEYREVLLALSNAIQRSRPRPEAIDDLPKGQP